jgi:hypothetical protein
MSDNEKETGNTRMTIKNHLRILCRRFDLWMGANFRCCGQCGSTILFRKDKCQCDFGTYNMWWVVGEKPLSLIKCIIKGSVK